MKGFIVTVAILAGLALAWVFGYIGVDKTEVDLRTKATAQQQVSKNVYNNAYTKIKMAAQIPDRNLKQSKEAFKEIYIGMMKERNAGKNKGGALMEWIHESHPEFDIAATTSLYAKIMDIIEASRDDFTREQNELADIVAEHQRHCKPIVNRILFMMEERDTLVAKYISTAKADEAFSTGQEQEADLNLYDDSL